MSHENLLGPAPTLLPDDGPDAPVRTALAGGEPHHVVAARHPASPLAWAALSEATLTEGAVQTPAPDDAQTVAAYAFARTGYHRGLDLLRRSGWRGQGPIPAAHPGNAGVLRALLALHDAAAAIGEGEEVARLAAFLGDAGTSVDEVAALR